MPNEESFLRPVDIINYLAEYLTSVRGGGDIRGAYEAGLALVGTVRTRPRANYDHLFSLARAKYEAGQKDYRPKSQDELIEDELEVLARENPNLVGRSYHLT